jgi:hypothetical protein
MWLAASGTSDGDEVGLEARPGGRSRGLAARRKFLLRSLARSDDAVGSTGQRDTPVEGFCGRTEGKRLSSIDDRIAPLPASAALLQPSANRQPTGLRTTGAVPGPLNGFGRSISLATAMASDLSAHRGRSALDRGCDPPQRPAFREATENLLAFRETEGPARTATGRRRNAAARREDVMERPSEPPERSSDVLRRLPSLPSLPELLLLRDRGPPSAISSPLHHLLSPIG